MQICVNENNIITGKATIGGFLNGIEISDEQGRKIDNVFGKYKYINGEIVVNEDYADEYLLQVKNEKIAELSTICHVTILNGVDCEYNGLHYDCTPEDTTMLGTLMTAINLGKVAVPYHAKDEACRAYNAAEFTAVYKTCTYWIAYHTTYFNELKHTVLEDLDDVDSVKKVTYGQPLSETRTQSLQANLALLM